MKTAAMSGLLAALFALVLLAAPDPAAAQLATMGVGQTSTAYGTDLSAEVYVGGPRIADALRPGLVVSVTESEHRPAAVAQLSRTVRLGGASAPSVTAGAGVDLFPVYDYRPQPSASLMVDVPLGATVSVSVLGSYEPFRQEWAIVTNLNQLLFFSS